MKKIVTVQGSTFLPERVVISYKKSNLRSNFNLGNIYWGVVISPKISTGEYFFRGVHFYGDTVTSGQTTRLKIKKNTKRDIKVFRSCLTLLDFLIFPKLFSAGMPLELSPQSPSNFNILTSFSVISKSFLSLQQEIKQQSCDQFPKIPNLTVFCNMLDLGQKLT